MQQFGEYVSLRHIVLVIAIALLVAWAAFFRTVSKTYQFMHQAQLQTTYEDRFLIIEVVRDILTLSAQELAVKRYTVPEEDIETLVDPEGEAGEEPEDAVATKDLRTILKENFIPAFKSYDLGENLAEELKHPAVQKIFKDIYAQLSVNLPQK